MRAHKRSAVGSTPLDFGSEKARNPPEIQQTPKTPDTPSTAEQRASAGQVRAFQSLYSEYAKQKLAGDHGRGRRLAWLSNIAGRQLATSKELTRAEADQAIDALQDALGRDHNRGTSWHYRDRAGAAAAGREGRTQSRSKVVTMASAADLARINDAVTRLGWSGEQFEAWLRSPRSPLSHSADPQIKTLADANRVWWAMKHMLKAAGKWHK